ncbi:bifunctional adenosylcobinamide kinase/adenosylcobinamide-phosphate guanylyltransferase [Nocardioides solisilvae]|uniref:bifunctional adenosylcobinamide kinase/adenosylcobinamide-phosphate guanylyltransferase n=1 Tax=Nocardioides solisilvae TaxID=1542435 RepID=UPI001EF5D376|nr:bifunctional adenosylcobinamide kinase/adenosylcobinamide-phosphate guanylyltransferase [Nocardioides solisilvae]
MSAGQGSGAWRSVLVTGGVRSGKSTHAERLAAGPDPVVYVAPGPVPDAEDPDWAARVAAHRERRPAGWRTVEGHDVAAAVASAGPATVLLDCLGTWVTAVVDAAQAWDHPDEELRAVVAGALEPVLEAVRQHPGRLVVVTNEVGMGIVPEHRSGRVFRDLLGTANQRVAAVCDEVHLVVAGRVLVL